MAPQINVDWVSAGAVGPVRNQGSTGRPTPIVAAEALEGITKIRDGTLRTIPEITLEECVGNMSSFYSYFDFVKNKGIDYTYVARQCTGSFKISGVNNVSTCDGLTNEIQSGPVAVAVDASNWQLYKSGIFTNCNPNTLNHAVLAVTLNDFYWRLKNSWGTTWGEAGYIRIGPGNTCGVCRFGERPK